MVFGTGTEDELDTMKTVGELAWCEDMTDPNARCWAVLYLRESPSGRREFTAAPAAPGDGVPSLFDSMLYRMARCWVNGDSLERLIRISAGGNLFARHPPRGSGTPSAG